MRGWLHLVVAMALLGGCVGGGEEAPPASGDELNDSHVSRAELPQGRDGSFAAFNETNRTEAGSGGLDHAHDLWEGRERVTLVEGNFGARWTYPPGSGAVAPLDMPYQKLVYEGTGQVEITLANPERRGCTNLYQVQEDGSLKRMCTDIATGTRAPDPTGARTGIRLQYKDAVSKDWKEAGEVQWGKTVVIPIEDPEQTDMPHATSTLWSFRLFSPQMADDTLTFDAKIELIRAEGAIPRWPGHPDFYAETTSRLVLQKTVTTKEDGLESTLQANAAPFVYAAPEKLVSYGTRTLYVYANVSRVTHADPAATISGWFMEFHNATARVNSTDDGGVAATQAWVLRVGDDGMDSPYGTESRWGFALRAIFAIKAPNGDGFWCSGCRPYEAEYDLTLIASSIALPDEEYDAWA